MTIKQGYGLRLKKSKVLLGAYIMSGRERCGNQSYHLTSFAETTPWVVQTKLEASYVRMFTTPWYNAGYETPMHDYKPEELEVVKIEIRESANADEPDFIPTFTEYMQMVYNTPGKKNYSPGHYEAIMDKYKRRKKDGIYDVYDLEKLKE